MADFFFFTDVESIVSQDVADRFGPISDFEYRADTKFNVSSNSKAYAVCDSFVLVQRDSSSGINIILKPVVQPDFNIGQIAYFIYRGIDPNSLVSGSNVAVRTNNDLTEKIWHNQEVTDTNSETGPNIPSVASIGLAYSSSGVDELLVPDSNTIESVFFKVDEYQLPLISAGEHIGDFIGGSIKCGFEIIIERVGIDPTMKIARAQEHLITITNLLGTTNYEKFLHFHKKEEILNYIDPVAFYGLFSHSKVGLKLKSTASATFTITDLILKFQNKNRIYLDLRNEYDYSFNYYYQYGSSLGLSFDPEDTSLTIPAFDFYIENASSTTSYGSWPIFIIENQGVIELSENELHGKLFLKIPDENNVLKSVYFLEGRKDGKERGINKNGESNRFEFPTLEEPLVSCSSWIYDDSGTPRFGASYIFAKLVFDNTTDYEGFFHPGEAIIDHLYSITKLKVDFFDRGDEDVALKAYQNGTTIERNEYPEHCGELYGATLGLAKDAESYVFFTHANQDSIGRYRKESAQPNFTFVTALHKNYSDFFLLLVKLTGALDIDVREIEDDSETHKTLRMVNTSLDLLENKIEPSMFDCLQFSHDEYDELINLVNTSNFIPGFDVYFAVKPEDTIVQEMNLFQWRQVQITLEGLEFVPGTSDTELRKKTVETGIFLKTSIPKFA